MKRCAAILVFVFTAASCLAQQSLSSRYTFQKIDYPNSLISYPLGINNLRTVVGTWFDFSFLPHGYLWKAGKFTSIDYPGALGTTSGGINDRGDIVGTFLDEYGFQHGYTLARPAGCGDADTNAACKPVFKQFDVPGAVQTVGVVFETGPGLGTAGIGINDFGERTGLYATQGQYSNGFLQLGSFTLPIDHPRASHTPGNGTKCFSVSNLSVLACDYQTQKNAAAPVITHGFLRFGDLNVPIDYPGAAAEGFGTQISGINIFGEATGVTYTQGSFNGILWVDGTFFTVNFPGMPYNELHSVSDRGDLTGAYASDPDGQVLHGYLAFPK